MASQRRFTLTLTRCFRSLLSSSPPPPLTKSQTLILRSLHLSALKDPHSTPFLPLRRSQCIDPLQSVSHRHFSSRPTDYSGEEDEGDDDEDEDDEGEEVIPQPVAARKGHFDDVQRAPALPSKPPKELKELDENKSKKGLAEICEEEYAQQSGLSSAPLSFEPKSEAFKRLRLELDALRHFRFAPKPVIEDMSIQANVPALAMEEIAPLAVSDAAMLAPEEVFKGKGDIKEDAELSLAEYKRRRANKKRKFKAETAKREAKKAHQNAPLSHTNEKDTGNEDS